MAGSEPRPPLSRRRPERAGAVTVSHPDLEWRETVQGSKPGDRFVRVATHKGFTRVRRGHLVPRAGTGAPTTHLGRALQRLSRVLIGRPIASAEEPHERLNIFKGLAVFASDNISSSAYATEEIMRVLVLAGAGVLTLTMPITGTIVSAPTYVYLLAIYGLLAYGLFRFATGTLPSYQPPAEWVQAERGGEALGLFLILRAFSAGSVALTGTEAVSNGVPAFQPPESRNARIVLILMGSCFGSIFLGMSFLAGQLGIVPDPSEEQTVISQLTGLLVGAGSPFHYLVQT